jgi:CRP-like cAMP-binding protein
MKSDLADFMQNSEWFNFVPAGLTTLLLERAHIFSVEENALVYDLHEELRGLYAVVEGVVAIRTDTPQTEAIYAYLMGPGSWVGEISVMTRTPSAIGVVAKTPCKVLVVPTAKLNELGKTHPELWRSLAILAAINARKALRVARNAMIKHPRERLQAVLDQLGNEIGFDKHIPLTQEQLAEICHLSLRATSKLLNQLADEGHVVCGYRPIKVLNPVKQ